VPDDDAVRAGDHGRRRGRHARRDLTVTELSKRSGLSRRKLARRLAGAPLKASELAALGLVLGRRPSDWFRIVEQQGVGASDTPSAAGATMTHLGRARHGRARTSENPTQRKDIAMPEDLRIRAARRHYAAQGLQLRKIPERSRWFPQYGPFMVTDPYTSNGMVEWNLSLEDIERLTYV